MLADAKRRAIFDKQGEEGLKASRGDDKYVGYTFTPSPPMDVFKTVLGNENPFAMKFEEEGTPNFGELRPPEPIVNSVYCTLEELYKGCAKNMKVTHCVYEENSKTTKKEVKVFNVQIKPGWRDGTRIVFEKQCHRGDPSEEKSDVVFVVSEKPHPTFSRSGNDLFHVHTVKLADALCGTTITLDTLDGRRISTPINTVVHPEYRKVVKGEGMRVPGIEEKRGDLLMQFNIIFPRQVSERQKALVQELNF